MGLCPIRCRTCNKQFNVRIGTIMQDSELSYQVWEIALYIITASIKGVSSMKLHRDLGVTQKTTWHLAIESVKYGIIDHSISLKVIRKWMKPISEAKRRTSMNTRSSTLAQERLAKRQL